MSSQRDEAFRAAMRACADKNGDLTAESVLEAAQDESNPLHEQFEWDDKIAGYRHRLDQARALIRRYEFISIIEDRVVRTIEYVKDPRTPNEQGYVPLSAAAKQRKLAIQIIDRELASCIGHIRRASQISSRLPIQTDIAELLILAIRIKEALPSTRKKSG